MSKSWADIRDEPYRRWYQFGLRSPRILFARTRNKHRWIFRLRMAWQRTTRGYGDNDLWSLHYSLAKLTVAGCRYLRENDISFPSEFSDPPDGDGQGPEAWNDILLRIEEGFQAWLDEDGYFYNRPDQAEKFREGMALYANWFGALWD